MITASAPGKLMIMGEHAVVYDSPCIVASAGLRLRVDVRDAQGEGCVIEAPQSNDTRFVRAALAEAEDRWGICAKGLKISTHSSFSSTYGFGSSSAVTVATLKALAGRFGISATNRELFESSYKVVLAVQGVGSGFDVASAVYGGILYFKRGGSLLEELRCGRPLPIVVGYTGVKADTKALVCEMAEKKKQFPDKVDRIFEAITGLVSEARVRIEEGDWKRVGTLCNFNQEYLRDLGVSSQKLEDLIGAANRAGAWGAKLSGAGGGDCMIAVVSRSARKRVGQAITEAGGEVVDVALGKEGVMAEGSGGAGEPSRTGLKPRRP